MKMNKNWLFTWNQLQSGLKKYQHMAKIWRGRRPNPDVSNDLKGQRNNKEQREESFMHVFLSLFSSQDFPFKREEIGWETQGWHREGRMVETELPNTWNQTLHFCLLKKSCLLSYWLTALDLQGNDFQYSWGTWQ